MKTVDCRLHAIEGYGEQKKWCDDQFKRLPALEAAALLLPTCETGTFYCQYNFKFEPNDDYSLKMLQPLGYLQYAWRQFAQTHELRAIYFADAELMDLASRGDQASKNLRYINLDATLPDEFRKSEPNPGRVEQPPKKPGLISILKDLVLGRQLHWLDRLEARLAPMAGDDFIAPSVLPEPKLELLRKFSAAIREAGKRDDMLWAERLFRVHGLLIRCHPQSNHVNWLQAKLFSGAHEGSDESATVRRMTAWISMVGATSQTRQFAQGWLALSGLVDEETWNAVTKIDEDTLTWRVYSEEPNYVPRRFAFASEFIRHTVADFPFSSLRSAQLHLELAQWFIGEEKYADALSILAPIVEQYISSPAYTDREIAFVAQERICAVHHFMGSLEESREAAERLLVATSREYQNDNPVHRNEYRMRGFEWKIKALDFDDISLKFVVFEEAIAFANTHINQSMRTAGFVCSLARVWEERFIMYRVQEDLAEALQCLSSAADLLEPLMHHRQGDDHVLISFEIFKLLDSYLTMASNLSRQMEDTERTEKFIERAVLAVHVLVQHDAYQPATKWTKVFPNMPEVQMEKKISEWTESFKKVIIEANRNAPTG